MNLQVGIHTHLRIRYNGSTPFRLACLRVSEVCHRQKCRSERTDNETLRKADDDNEDDKNSGKVGKGSGYEEEQPVTVMMTMVKRTTKMLIMMTTTTMMRLNDMKLRPYG